MTTDSPARPIAASAAPPDPQRLQSGPVYCIVNAGSGRETGEEKSARLREALARYGREGEILLADPAGVVSITDLADRAVALAEQHQGIVVVAGGDGTVSAVARRAVERAVPMGVIPEGTFNLLARDHGIPEDIDAAIEVAFHGRTVPVQVGIANDLLFLVNASLGLYPKLLADREELKSVLGRSRFVALLASLKTVFGQFRPLHIELEVDGRHRRLKTTSLFIGNNRLQLERLGLEQAAALAEHRLVLLNAPPFGHLTAISLMLKAAIGRLGQSADFEVTTFRELETARTLRPGGRRRPMGIALDGERFRIDPPIRIGIHRQALWLIVPTVPGAVADAAAATAAAPA